MNMRRYRVVHLWVLIIGFATSSPKMMAQLAPAAELPLADESAVLRATTPLIPPPILAYSPPTEKERLRRYQSDVFGPHTFAKVVLAAGLQQASNSPPEWGGGWNAFGKRAASKFGIKFVATTARYGMAEMLREDTAYYPCQCSGFFPRFGHALTSTLTGRHGQDGHTTFSFPKLISPYAGTMTALTWYPDRYGLKDGLRMGSSSFVGYAIGNLALEFIFRGPHSLFSRLGRSKSPGGTAQLLSP